MPVPRPQRPDRVTGGGGLGREPRWREQSSEVQLEVRTAVHAAIRRGPRRGGALWRVGTEGLVRQGDDRTHPVELPRRPRWPSGTVVAQGQGRRPRRAGARGAAGGPRRRDRMTGPHRESRRLRSWGETSEASAPIVTHANRCASTVVTHPDAGPER